MNSILSWIGSFILLYIAVKIFTRLFIRPISVRKRFTMYLVGGDTPEIALEKTAIDHNIEKEDAYKYIKNYMQ